MTFNFNDMTNEDILSWVCVLVIGVFMVIAKPENTSTLFSNPVAKAVIFLIIVGVVYTDLKLGVLFGLAMLMTIVYSQMTSSNSEVESFANDESQSEPEKEEGFDDCLSGESFTNFGETSSTGKFSQKGEEGFVDEESGIDSFTNFGDTTSNEICGQKG